MVLIMYNEGFIYLSIKIAKSYRIISVSIEMPQVSTTQQDICRHTQTYTHDIGIHKND